MRSEGREEVAGEGGLCGDPLLGEDEEAAEDAREAVGRGEEEVLPARHDEAEEDADAREEGTADGDEEREEREA